MREIRFRVWDNVDYMSSPFTLQDLQLRKVQFTTDCKVMQFTGLQDKDGTDIYEGDIIDYGNNRFKPVEFIDGAFCICGNTAMPTLMTLYNIVGNIFQHPELLNK